MKAIWCGKYDCRPARCCTQLESPEKPIDISSRPDYIRRPGLWADVRLLLKTLPAVIRGRGAY